MTENEAIKCLEKQIEIQPCMNVISAFEIAIQALEEIQQYRAIGLTPELIEAMQGHNIAMINDLEEYQEIGTVEELKEIRAKAIDEFAHQLKETLNQEFPSNYESTRPYFSLENARLSVDEVAEQMKAGGIEWVD